jgi:hypothetical protein
LTVNEIELGIVFPLDKVGVVIMHSQVRVNLTSTEPFRWQEAAIPIQLENIKRTLDIARTSDHEAEQTHITIFPEYSVPSLIGINLIDRTFRSADWKANSLIIAGIDGLSLENYRRLCATENLHIAEGSEPANIADGKWVNCFVMWAKTADNQVRQFVQAKLVPAWPEQNNQCEQMHCGNSVFLFKAQFANGHSCRFLSVICYDWIGKGPTQI